MSGELYLQQKIIINMLPHNSPINSLLKKTGEMANNFHPATQLFFHALLNLHYQI